MKKRIVNMRKLYWINLSGYTVMFSYFSELVKKRIYPGSIAITGNRYKGTPLMYKYENKYMEDRLEYCFIDNYNDEEDKIKLNVIWYHRVKEKLRANEKWAVLKQVDIRFSDSPGRT